MNVILALVINVGSVSHYGRLYTPPVVDTVLDGRPAALAGLQRGDSIVAIDGTPVTEWQQLLDRVSASARTDTSRSRWFDDGAATRRCLFGPRSARCRTS